jgi:hypothetical protein
MSGGDMLYGIIILLTGILLFVVGATVLSTIYWVGVCFVLTSIALLGFGVFVMAMAKEPFPMSRGF